jgi:hypothetical protein
MAMSQLWAIDFRHRALWRRVLSLIINEEDEEGQ